MTHGTEHDSGKTHTRIRICSTQWLNFEYYFFLSELSLGRWLQTLKIHSFEVFK